MSAALEFVSATVGYDAPVVTGASLAVTTGAS
jgi:hypothetical protein